MSVESFDSKLIHEAKWNLRRQPRLAARSCNMGVEVPKDPIVPWWNELAKYTHKHSAVIGSPTAELEVITEIYGDHLIPAISLDVRLGGIIPKRIMATLIDETFQEFTHDGRLYSIFACRMGPHPFTARLGKLDPNQRIFHMPETTELIEACVPHVRVAPLYGAAIY